VFVCEQELLYDNDLSTRPHPRLISGSILTDSFERLIDISIYVRQKKNVKKSFHVRRSLKVVRHSVKYTIRLLIASPSKQGNKCADKYFKIMRDKQLFLPPYRCLIFTNVEIPNKIER
jgi:hypothetical protein